MRRGHGISSRQANDRAQFKKRMALLLLFGCTVYCVAYLLQQAVFTQPPSAADAQAAAPITQTAANAVPSDAHLDTDVKIASTLSAASIEMGFQSAVMQDGVILERYENAQSIRFDDADSYAAVKGLTTFAGGNYRDTFTYGTQTLINKSLSRVWEREVGSLKTASGDTWEGTGWTGMPLIVQWNADVRNTLGVADIYKQMEDFTEVIYPATDGKIYFLELQTGAQTREPIEIGVVMKSAALDPRGYPILYVGQGAEDEVDGKGAWLRAISLIDNSVIWRFGGRDPFALRAYQAYDASALIDGKTDMLYLPGENGIFYSAKLNTAFSPQTASVSISPEPLVKYRYAADDYGEEEEKRNWGVESSLAAFGQYGFFTDNGGLLQCVDLNTMYPAYVVDMGAESDATPVIEPAEDTFYVYTATLASSDGMAYQMKYDGKTGELIWKNECATVDTGDASDTRGSLGTPHVGHGGIDNLVIFNCTMIPYSEEGQSKRGGSVTALSKETGKAVWTYAQAAGCWSSPVVLYDEAENAYVVQCDRMGVIKLLDGKTGAELFSLDMGSRIESTPAVFSDMLVVGTRGKYGSGESAKIIGVKIG